MIEVSPLVLAALLASAFSAGATTAVVVLIAAARRKPMANPYAGPQQARGPGSHP